MIKHIPGKIEKKQIVYLQKKIKQLWFSSLLLVSSTHLYILRKLPEHKTMANLYSQRPLNTIIKITSKKNIPEIITFRYVNNQEQDDELIKSKGKSIIDCDKVYLPDAGDATKNIKLLIMKALNMVTNSNETVST